MRRLPTRVTASLAVLALAGAAASTWLVVPSPLTPAAHAQPVAPTLENGLARTPPMGYNNWNSTGCRAEFNEAFVKATADLFVSSGLKSAGYNYVNLDDCWAEPKRNAQGNLVAHRTRFPNGIKAVADYVHSKGLKFGIYTSAGTLTCNKDGRFPGGIGHEQQDANLFASWGVDYLKYDNCGNHQGQSAIQRYTKMRDALKNTGRPIVYSICEWGRAEPKVWTWAKPVGNLWRTTDDIKANWGSVMHNLHINEKLAQYSGPGAWNDPDMLEVGNGMSVTEQRSHFSLWAMMAAPLLIGTDLRKATPTTMDILKNTDLIAVDQDALGKQATVVKSAGGLTVYAKPLANGDSAVALFNESGATATISTTVSEIGMGGASSYTLRDLWTKSSRSTTGAISASVPSHATVVYRVSKGELTPPPAGTSQLSSLSWASATNGWGPVEKDRSNGEQPAGDGRTLTINGTTYATGLGVHAASEITYHLGGQCTALVVDVGVDDEKTSRGTVVFQIYRDGTKVADSGTMTTATAAKQLTANLTEGTTLRLVTTDAGDGTHSDHADWANARLTCT
jgi:alpha-galactosidase